MSEEHPQAKISHAVAAALIDLAPSEVGRRIKLARVAMGLSQAEVATAAGVSPGYFSRIETGTRRVPVAMLAAVAEVTGVQAAALVGLTPLSLDPAPDPAPDPPPDPAPDPAAASEPIEVALPRLLQELTGLPTQRRRKLEALVLTHAALIASRLAEGEISANLLLER